MRTPAHKRKTQNSSDDLWAWAQRRESPSSPVLREDPSAKPTPWYRGVWGKLKGG